MKTKNDGTELYVDEAFDNALYASLLAPPTSDLVIAGSVLDTWDLTNNDIPYELFYATDGTNEGWFISYEENDTTITKSITEQSYIDYNYTYSSDVVITGQVNIDILDAA